MSSAKERTRNNVRVGVFVTIALIMAMGVLIILTDVISPLLQDSRAYRVRFNVASGVSNLKSGADVRVGGVSLGSVTKVTPDVEARPFAAILVDITLDSRVTLFSDAEFVLSSSLLGSEAWLDCPSVGHPNAEGNNEMAEGATLNAADAAGMLTALFGPDGARKTESIVSEVELAMRTLNEHGMLAMIMGVENEADAEALIENVIETAANVRRTTDRFDQKSGQILDNVEASTGDMRAMTAQIKNEQWPQWSGSVTNIFAWAEAATTDIDATMEEGRLLFADSRAVINDNRERIDAMVVDAGEVMRYANTELKDKVSGLLDRGRDGLDSAVAVLERAKTDYEGWAVGIGETLGNASLTAQQLKLATIEIRRSPWKLLYKPTEQELEHEHLYEAARSFAVAAADIKAASMSVDRMLDRYGDELSQDRELFDRVTRLLIDPLERYETAQQRLFDVLVTEGE